MKNCLIIALLLSIILLQLKSVLSIRINEIMYNPAGNDYDFEFIELYSNETINLSNYYFEGIDFVFPENITMDGYSVIANTCNENFTVHYNVNCSLEYQGTLSNQGETITLFSPDGGIVAQVNYSDTAPENYSLEITSNGWLVSEIEGGTPGSENSHPFFLNASLNQTINESINETVNETINETINESINETNTTNFCNPSLTIETCKINYYNKEQIKFRHVIANKTEPYQIEYWIEDLFGEIIKSKYNTTNTNEKSYTPSIKEKDKILLIKSILYIECNDTNLSNNHAEKTIFVVNPDYSEEKDDKKTSSNDNSKSSSVNKKDDKAKISSFYTLTKKFEANKTIKIFSYISNPGQSSEFSLFFTHNKQPVHTQNLAISEDEIEKITFEHELEEGNNSFGLELYQNNFLIDYKELSLFVNYTKKIVDNQSSISKEKFINNTKLQIDTGKEADEGALKKKSNIAYYIFLGLSVVFNAILIWKR